MGKVIFKYADQSYIYQKLLDAVNQLCMDYKKDCTCVAGYRSLTCQKATNAGVLATRKGAYQLPNGAVYTGTGANRKCWASAYGQSGHCFCICMDIDDEWFKALTNAQLKKYGLVKSVPHENWHVTLIELVGISQNKKVAIRDSVLNKGVTKKVETVTKPMVQPTKTAVIDELADALKFICSKCDVNYDHWYKAGKDNKTKYLDVFIVKVAEGFRGK